MAEIDKMIKYSAETVGVYQRAKLRIKDFSSKVFGEQNKERVAPATIQIMDAKDSVPADIKNVISKIKGLPLWDKETLENIDPKMAKHINGLSKSINALIEKMSNVKGENNVLNAEYSDLQTAFVEYLKITEDYSKSVGDMISAQKASITKQKEGLGVSSSSHATQSLISAFAYMGREIKVNPDGTYECGDAIDGSGFRYRDAEGNAKYIAISKEATQSFIDNYLKTGGVNTEKEENDLAEAKDALRQMKENQKEVGMYAPTPADISAQEKAVENAQRALNEKMASVVTPKGLFTYFVEQELIGDTRRGATDKFSLIRARNEFSTESKSWKNFEIEKDPQLFLDDLSLMATNALNAFKMQEIAERDVPAYGDDVKSDFASGIINSNRLDRLESDLLRLRTTSNDLASQNGQNFQEILEKYEALADSMEESSKLDKTSSQASLIATEARARVETLRSFGELVIELSDQIEAGEIPAPENVKNNITGFVGEIVSNSTFENGVLSLNKDLTNEAGDIWLSKDTFEKLMTEQMEAIKAEMENEVEASKETEVEREEVSQDTNGFANTDTLEQEEVSKDIERAFISSAYGTIFEGEETFADAMDGLSQRVMLEFLIGDENNSLSRLYDGYVNQNDDAITYYKSVMGEDFDPNVKLLGLFSVDVLCDTLDQMTGRGEYAPNTEKNQENNVEVNASQNTNVTNTKAEIARDKARRAFFYMDVVINAIKADEKLYAEYVKGDSDTKDKIFREKYEQIKPTIKNPSEEQLEKAEKKYLKTYQADKISAIANEIGDKKIPEEVTTILNKLAEQYGLVENVKDQTQNAPKEGEKPKQEAGKKKFGDLYPRSPSAKAIAKKLQPFNIAAGIKFFNQLLDAFQKIEVKMGGEEEDTKKVKTGASNGGVKEASNDGNGGGFNNNEAKASQDNQNNLDNAGAEKQNNGASNEANKAGEELSASAQEASQSSESAQEANEQVVEQVEPQVAKEGDKASKLFEGRTDDQIRSRLAVMSVGMGINSILDELKFNEDVQVDRIRQAMDYMTMQELPQPVVNIKINGRTSAVILSDAMQYVFLNEFACGNKDASEASKSIDEIASQLGNNEAIVSVVKSMSPLMGAITPGEIVHLVKQTAEVENPQPGEPMSIDLGSKLTPEDIAEFRKLNSMAQVRALLEQSEMYNQDAIKDIFDTGNKLREEELKAKLGNPKKGELTID